MVRLRDVRRHLVEAVLACCRALGLLAAAALKYAILRPKWVLRITLLLGVLWFGVRQHSTHGIFNMPPSPSSVFSFSSSSDSKTGHSAARMVGTFSPSFELVLGRGHHFPILLECTTLLKAQLRLAGHMLEQQWQHQRGGSVSYNISHTNVAVLLDQLALQADEVKFAHHMGLHHDRDEAQRGSSYVRRMWACGREAVCIRNRCTHMLTPYLPSGCFECPTTCTCLFSAGTSRQSQAERCERQVCWRRVGI
jgi:hypothetical protein